MLVRDKFYIGGQWVAPSGAQTIDVHNAGTGEVMGRVPAGTEKDIDAAAEGWTVSGDGTVRVKLAPGQLRQLDPSQHPTKRGASNGFSVEVVVKSGKALAAAQLLRTSTQDPAYVVGVVR